MSLVGKKLVIPGADFSELAISMEIFVSIPLIANLGTYIVADGEFADGTYRAYTIGNFKKGDIIEYKNPDSTFDIGMSVYRMANKQDPEFTGGVHPSQEFYTDFLAEYERSSFEVQEDGRYMFFLKDYNQNLNRDFSPHSNFGLFTLKRKYETGEPRAIHAYYGTFNTETSSFTHGEKIRAFAMVDVKKGTRIDTFNPYIGLTAFKMRDGTPNIYECTLLSEYLETVWVSDAEQRVLLFAKNNLNPDGTITDNLNEVFKITF